jgi:beta-glucosidase
VVSALQEYASLWVTINEPNVYAYFGFISGEFPPGKQQIQAGFQVMASLVRGHAAAYRAIHALQPQAQVGLAINYRSLQPARPGFPPDRWAAGAQAALINAFFPRALRDGILNYVYKKVRLPEAAGTQDFLGIQYYTRDLVRFDLTAASQAFGRLSFPPGALVSTTGFLANVPEGLFEALKWGLQFKVPLIVTENGVEDREDTLRPRYIVEHIHQLWRAVNFTWPIKGYFHWSLVDNFEWERGWTQPFGLWELDRETQARRRRKSVDVYQAICRQNGLSSDTVERYTPELMEKLFPG